MRLKLLVLPRLKLTALPQQRVLLVVVQHIAQVSFARLVRAMLPFYVPLVIALLMLTYLPELSLWLPRFVKG